MTVTPVVDPYAAYVTVEDAVLLLSALPVSPGITAWLSLSEDEQVQSLFAAVKVLDVLNWAGHKCTCEQKLQWPRRIANGCCFTSCDSIPQDIQLANAYLAAFMGEQGGFVGIDSTTSGSNAVAELEPFEAVKIGPIEVKMKQNVIHGDELTTNIGQIPPFVADLIRNYLLPFGTREGWMTRRSVARSWDSYLGSSSYTGSMYLRDGRVYPRVGGWFSNGRIYPR